MIHIGNFCPYWSYPTTGGGPIRVYNFNYAISKHAKITQHSFRPTVSSKFFFHDIFNSKNIILSENYSEIQHLSLPTLFSSYLLYKIKQPHDLLLSNILNLTFRQSFDFDILQVEHPWLFKYVDAKNKSNLPIVLVAHNFEYNLIKDTVKNDKWLSSIKKIEIDALNKSDAIFAVSPLDILSFIDEGVESNKIHLVPNGVDTNKFNFTSDKIKDELKSKYGYDGKKIVFFSGSVHTPNIEAVEKIEKLAADFEDGVIFLVIGKAGDGFKSTKNFICTGFVDEMMDYIKMADIAINPLISGSGTNLKMLEYFAAGVPTVTTPTGARGIDILNMKHAIICEIDDFKDGILTLIADEKLSHKITSNARKLVEDTYDWNVIAKIAFGVYDEILTGV